MPLRLTAPALRRLPTIPTRCALAGIATLAGLLLRLALSPVLGTSVPYITFYPVILLGAYYGGRFGGLLTTTLSAFATNYMIATRERGGVAGTIVFLLVGAGIALLTDAFRRATVRAATSTATAEERLGALQQTTEVLQAIVHASPVPIVTLTTDGAVTLWNTAAESAFGWRAEEVLGRPLPFIPAEKQDEHRAMRERDLHGKGFAGREICRVRKDGTPIWLLVSTAPTRDTNGAITGIVSVYLDITKRKQGEEQLQRQADALAQSNAELEQYAFAASHDLQEPLRNVMLYTELLMRRHVHQLDATGQTLLNVVHTSAQRMQALIADLLSYSRIGHDIKTSVTLIPAGELVKEAIASVQTIVTDTKATVHCDELPTVRGDRQQLVRLFQNLLENAIKYRKPDQAPQIIIDATRSNGGWEFHVEDNGVGFDPQYATRIFGLFKRLHGQDIPGTGIGLALCKRIIEQHGGRIWATSEPTKGSAIHFTLPA
jgi:PAS domain S-box-containing protein